MPYDFPSSPTTGQIVTSPGGAYRWDGVKWGAGSTLTAGTGTVTSVGTGIGLTGGPITSSGTIALANTSVPAGSYTFASLTVDAQGRLTAASSGITPPVVSATIPLMNGTAVIGSDTTHFAAADHVHPTDTTRAPTASPTLTGTTSVVGLTASSSVIANAGITVNNTVLTANAGLSTTNISAGTLTATGAVTGISLTESGSGARIVGDANYTYWYMDSGSWRLQYNRTNGNLNYYNASSSSLLQIDNSGITYASAGFNGPAIYATTGIYPYSTDTAFVIYRGSGARYIQYASGYFWSYVEATGELYWAVAGTTALWYPTSDKIFRSMLGAVQGNGAYINSASDERVKRNIEPVTYGLDEVLALKPVTWNRVEPDTGELREKRDGGFLAQDVLLLIPEAVVETGIENAPGGRDLGDGGPALGMMDTPILAACVRAIQQLHERIATLEGRA